MLQAVEDGVIKRQIDRSVSLMGQKNVKEMIACDRMTDLFFPRRASGFSVFSAWGGGPLMHLHQEHSCQPLGVTAISTVSEALQKLA
jgi:hypothetical protein